MKTIEYNFVENKADWGEGPWLHEPDKIQYIESDTGLPCIIRRNDRMGNLCGYVGVDERHPLFGVEYQNVSVDVHGGLTYSSLCQPEEKEHGICHTVEPGENDKVYWFGFDCGHAFDLMPGLAFRERELDLALPAFAPSVWDDTTYRTVDYVKGENTDLGEQLVSLALKG